MQISICNAFVCWTFFEDNFQEKGLWVHAIFYKRIQKKIINMCLSVLKNIYTFILRKTVCFKTSFCYLFSQMITSWNITHKTGSNKDTFTLSSYAPLVIHQFLAPVESFIANILLHISANLCLVLTPGNRRPPNQSAANIIFTNCLDDPVVI